MEYKGFSFPQDVPLFLYVPLKIVKYQFKIHKLFPAKILAALRSKNKQATGQEKNAILRLGKMYKLISFLLVKTLHSERPCLIRSLILYEEAMKLGMPANIYIGVKKEDDRLTGHSWITIGGHILMEDPNEIEKYTVMLSE